MLLERGPEVTRRHRCRYTQTLALVNPASRHQAPKRYTEGSSIYEQARTLSCLAIGGKQGDDLTGGHSCLHSALHIDQGGRAPKRFVSSSDRAEKTASRPHRSRGRASGARLASCQGRSGEYYDVGGNREPSSASQLLRVSILHPREDTCYGHPPTAAQSFAIL